MAIFGVSCKELAGDAGVGSGERGEKGRVGELRSQTRPPKQPRASSAPCSGLERCCGDRADRPSAAWPGGGRLFVLLSPPELRLETNVSVLVLFPAERSCRPESRAWKHSPERRDARGPHPARFLPGRLPLLPAPASTGRSGLLAPRCRRSASVPEGTPAKQHAHPADPFGNNPWSALLPPSLSGFRGLKAVLFLACRGFCVFAIDVSPKLLVLCLG